jgi:hypothetical protein
MTDSTKQPSRANRPDGQFVDEVRIVTVPRWKESELSGDEWRISARIAFYRKGILVGEARSNNIRSAVQFVDWHMMNGGENGDIKRPEIRDLCDQEGCSRPWTTMLNLKKRYSNDGFVHPGACPEYRCFCDRHKERGDCGLEDADSNYEKAVQP